MKLFRAPDFTAVAADIDELGHVNNAVWVRWIQQVATAHWQAAAQPEHLAAFIWVVTRHEIDYLRALKEGETVQAHSWIEGPARGARAIRLVEFRGDAGTVYVRARTDWAMISLDNHRPIRVPPQVLAPFLD